MVTVQAQEKTMKWWKRVTPMLEGDAIAGSTIPSRLCLHRRSMPQTVGWDARPPEASLTLVVLKIAGVGDCVVVKARTTSFAPLQIA